jgi:hypothetical protein
MDTVIDWLLLHNEMSNEQYVSYIHDENKLSSPYIKLYRN